MFKLISEAHVNDSVSININGQLVSVPKEITVASALLLADKIVFRETPAKASPRGPFCMMGSCFDCLVEINGVSNQQACMVNVEEGMRIEKQSGLAKVLSTSERAVEDRGNVDA